MEGVGSRIALTGGSVQTSGYGAAGLSAVAGGALDITGMRVETQGTTASGLQLEDAAATASNVHITTLGPGPEPDPGEGGEGGEGIDPVDPIRPPPVLRPEAGAYLANQSAAVNTFAHRLSDQTGALNSGDGRNAWARVGRQQSDFSAVGGQLSVDGSTSVLQIGSDLLRRGDVVFGVMLGSGRADSSVVSQLTGYGAKGRVRGAAVGVYGTWLQDAEGTRGAYVDANVQHGRFDNRVQGIGLEPEQYDSRMASASLEAGYVFNVWQGALSQLYVQPQLQLSYVDFDADRHVEHNGTVIDRADAGGLNGRLGVRVFGRCTAAGNVVQPYMGLNWLRGSGTSTLQFNGDMLGADVPRNRYEVQAGAELKLGQCWGAWGGMTVQRGDQVTAMWGATGRAHDLVSGHGGRGAPGYARRLLVAYSRARLTTSKSRTRQSHQAPAYVRMGFQPRAPSCMLIDSSVDLRSRAA